MNKKIGFIGAGKMANAIMGGISTKLGQSFSFTDINDNIASTIQKKYNSNRYNTNVELVQNCDIIIMCIKPFIVDQILEEIKPYITKSHLIISILAGVTLKKIENTLLEKTPVIRVMPNTPALINEGMSVICPGTYVLEEDLDIALNIFSQVGLAKVVDEDKMDVVTAISGSGPAFYYYIIDQIAKSGLFLGLDYETALILSAQTCVGAGKMVLEYKDIKTLIDNVTTKGGCTEVGNKCLENSDISKVLLETIKSTSIKAQNLGKTK